MKSKREIEEELKQSAINLVKVIRANKLQSVKLISEPSVPVGSTNTSPVSPPPSVIKPNR